MDRVEEGQYTARQQWMKWDAESVAIQSAIAEVQVQPSNSASFSSASDNELYYLESLMESQSGGSVDNELPDMDYLRKELIPIAWLTNPPASPLQNFVVPDNYRPATPIHIYQPPLIIGLVRALCMLLVIVRRSMVTLPFIIQMGPLPPGPQTCLNCKAQT